MLQSLKTILPSRTAERPLDPEINDDQNAARISLLSNVTTNSTAQQDDIKPTIAEEDCSISVESIPNNTVVILSFHQINYSVGSPMEVNKRRSTRPFFQCFQTNEHKQILLNISGRFSKGLNAILGPTGCGKSSLLDILADRKDPHSISGRVLVDGEPRRPSFKYTVGYVTQEDVFSEELTVRENLFFSANLRLPKTVSKREKNDRVLRVIDDLALESCADTRVGTALFRKVSGGEKKRISIGMELVLSSKILFLDEPTTGLDASTAINVMNCLRKLAEEGRESFHTTGTFEKKNLTCCLEHTGTIIFSIHQPRYSILKLFDTVMFMCQGQCVYHGPIKDVVSYFSNLNYQCEEHENPTDFVLDILISACRTPDGLVRLNDAYQQTTLYTDIPEPIQQRNNVHNTEKHDRHEGNFEVEAARTFQAELFYVLQRTLRITLRNPAIALSQIIVAIIVALLVGLVFHNMQKTTDPGVQNRHGAIFFIVVNEIFSSMTAIEALIQERLLFLHEYVSGYYRIQTFFIAKLICDLSILRAIPSIFFCTIVYFMMGFGRTSGQFLTFLVTLFMARVFGSAMCFFISTFSNTFVVVLIVVVLIYVLMMIFAGFLIELATIFKWLSWIHWISAFRYASNVLTINEFQGLKFCLPNQTNICPMTGEDVLHNRGISHGTAWNLWQNFFVLTMMTTTLFILAYIRLLRGKKTR